MARMRRRTLRGDRFERVQGRDGARGAICSAMVIVAVLGADRGTARSTMVFPPGQESVLAKMVGADGSALSTCSFAGGAVTSASMKAEYACPTGAVAVEIRHPDASLPGDVRTRQFAIGVRSGMPPPDFLPALLERVRAREAAFTWAEISDPAGPQENQNAVSAVPGDHFTRDAVLLVAVVALPAATCLVGLVLAVRTAVRYLRKRRAPVEAGHS